QRQRVAMGRAIVRPNPNAFLMDEPLSNLDPKLRDEMQTLVADLQKELRVTTIYVTHDQTEAMKLGDRLVVMREGKVEQNGAPQELYEHPKNLFVAAFIGSPAMNFQPARLEDSVLRCALGKLPLSDRVRRTLEAAGAPREVIVGIRPEHFEDAALAQPWAGRHGATFTSRVARLESTGADKYAHFKLDDEPIGAAKRKELVAETDTADVAGVTSLIARLSRASAATQGEMVKICFDPDLVQIFHPSDGRNLTLPPEMPCGTQLHRLGARAPG
ncbi:MAG: ABC transporter ATP-binding protein, partial [bacterium]